VDAGTGVTRWQGEDCDYGMAVEVLLRRDERRLRGDVSPQLTCSKKVPVQMYRPCP
jgi:hypothetical protein